jgi:hypothetical protein
LLLKNGKTTTFLYPQASTSIVALKADLFEALHEHTRKHTLQLAGVLPKSPDIIVLGTAAVATIAARDCDGRAGGRTWYPLDGQDKKKATVKHVGINNGDAVIRMCRDEEFDVQVMEIIEDWLDAELSDLDVRILYGGGRWCRRRMRGADGG